LVRRNTLLVLNLGLHILNRIGWFNIQSDGLASQCLNKNLYNWSLRITLVYIVIPLITLQPHLKSFLTCILLFCNSIKVIVYDSLFRMNENLQRTVWFVSSSRNENFYIFRRSMNSFGNATNYFGFTKL
jgi:hypothetical protein